MTLLKTSALTAISTSIRLAALFLANKIMAVLIGPAGLALTGQFLNFATLASVFSNGGINSGIVRCIAESRDHPSAVSDVLSNALAISISFSITLSLIFIWARNALSSLLLGNSTFHFVFVVFGFSLLFIALNNCIVSAVNGLKEVRAYVAINILSSILGLVFVAIFVYFFRLTGSFLAVVLSQAAALGVSLFFVRKARWFQEANVRLKVNPEVLRRLLRYSIMTLVSAIAIPVTQVCVRSYIVAKMNVEAAGLWEGVWRISEAYLMLITASLSVYYLPRLSEIADRFELRKEILSGYRVIMPIVTVMALSVYLSRFFVVDILFSPEFHEMEKLFSYQLIGDVLKIGSWLLSFIMVAKAMVRAFVITEVLFSVSFVALSMFFVDRFGLVGANIAFAVNYFLYLLVMLVLFRRLIFIRSSHA